jgi:cytochrome c oxidase cbb3-type subunit 2
MTRIWLLLLGACATVGFALLILVIVPSVMLLDIPVPPQLKPYSDSELAGRQVYIANGCIYCHSQQIRDAAFTTDVARGWGDRASVPGDYLHDRPHLLGTMRTGPDLINVGARLPDRNWHLLHLYQPRALVAWSIMPAFPFLFVEKDPAAVAPGDEVVRVTGAYAPAGKVVVARPEAVALVDYLLSLKRNYPVPPADTTRAAGAPAPHGMP